MAKARKAAWRSLFGTIMMGIFAFIISCGHAYVCLLVFFLQCCLFGELVGVRKKMAAERRLPLFRSIQWAWFLTAAFYTWSDGMFAYIRENPFHVRTGSDVLIGLILEKSALVSLALYSGLLMVSIVSLRKGLYRYQITQYSWTLVTVCIVVFQMRAVFQTIYSGLFWFVLPCSLVICNDIAAYFFGVSLGRRFVKRSLLELSPNKTWEGFIGGAVSTIVFAWCFSGYLCRSPLMVCIPKGITLGPMAGPCTMNVIYQARPLHYNPEEPFLPRRLLTYALSGLPLVGVSLPEAADAQFHALALATFASFVSPFGGFLASAIKRAYGIKDFAATIPGHGGLMDRFDCQFVMAMCTYVHLMTFCRIQAPPSIEGLLAAAAQMTLEDRAELVRRLQGL